MAALSCHAHIGIVVVLCDLKYRHVAFCVLAVLRSELVQLVQAAQDQAAKLSSQREDAARVVSPLPPSGARPAVHTIAKGTSSTNLSRSTAAVCGCTPAQLVAPDSRTGI